MAEAILRDLRVVSISLGDEDDAQVIFETLNGHGAELHATDLIRNFIFMRADRTVLMAISCSRLIGQSSKIHSGLRSNGVAGC